MLSTRARLVGQPRSRSRLAPPSARHPCRAPSRMAVRADVGGVDRRGTERGDHAVGGSRGAEQVEGDAGVRRGQLLDLLPDLVDRLQPQVAAEAAGELGGDDPVGAGGAGRRHGLAQQADAALDVGGGPRRLGVAGDRQHDVGLGRGLVEVEVEGDDRAGTGEGADRQLVVGEVGHRVGAEQHEGVDPAVGRRGQDAGGVEPVLGWHRVPRGEEPVATLVERHPAGQQAGSEAHVERAVHVGPPQGRQEPRARPGVEQVGRGIDDVVAAVGQRRAAHHHRDRPLGQQCRRGQVDLGLVGAVGGAAAVEQGAERVHGLARAVAHRGRGQVGERGAGR